MNYDEEFQHELEMLKLHVGNMGLRASCGSSLPEEFYKGNEGMIEFIDILRHSSDFIKDLLDRK